MTSAHKRACWEAWIRPLSRCARCGLTGEAIVLRHASEFPPNVIEAAKRRLTKAGVDIAALPDRL